MPKEIWILRLKDVPADKPPTFATSRDRFGNVAFLWFANPVAAEFAAENWGPMWEAVRVDIKDATVSKIPA